MGSAAVIPSSCTAAEGALRARLSGFGRAVLAGLLVFAAFHAPAQTPTSPVTVPVTDAGEVVFVAGSVMVTRPGAEAAALRKGDRVEEGDVFVSAADGYAYIRLRDEGLLVLRPKTNLSIDTWRYDPVRPQLSQIHYTLNNGVARHVSGIAAKSARDKFRLNTPVAAIGVRGTDFTVLAEQGLTRVTVRSGGVIVSGLGGDCRAEGLGPCEGQGSAELFASMANARDKMLQFRAGDARPQLVDTGAASPDRARPPATGEPVAGKGATGQDVQVAEARTGKITVPEKVGDQGTLTPVDPIPPPPLPAVASWGRWQVLAGQNAPASIDDILKDRGLVGLNNYYVLGANPAVTMDMPGAGAVDLKLTASEGFFVDPRSGTATASTASNGTLHIDFGSRRFQTGLDLAAGNASTRIDAQGSVDPNGNFASDLFVSQSKVLGVVGNKGGSAAYIYQRVVNDGLTAVGGTTWGK